MVLPQTSRLDRGLSRKQRLKSAKLLQETFEQNRRFAGRLMIMWLRNGTDASLRLGVVAGRSIGGAVQRNRAKRRLRELFRLHRHRLRGGCDVVLMARGKLGKASWDEARAELISLAARADILAGNESQERALPPKKIT